jgi:hypothetical protein
MIIYHDDQLLGSIAAPLASSGMISIHAVEVVPEVDCMADVRVG